MPLNAILKTAAIAGATGALSWLLLRAQGSRDRASARLPRRPVEHWENEGGALAPQPGQLDTSQVPR